MKTSCFTKLSFGKSHRVLAKSLKHISLKHKHISLKHKHTSLKHKHISLKHRQCGDFLIEAMIGALIMGIVGAGISTIAGKVSTSQSALEIQNRAISDLKSLLIEGNTADLCSNASRVRNTISDNMVAVTATNCAPSASEASAANPNIKAVEITIGTKTVTAPSPLVLEATIKVPSTSNAGPVDTLVRVGQVSP